MGSPNKGMEQTSGAVAGMEAPLAAHPQRSTDGGLADGNADRPPATQERLRIDDPVMSDSGKHPGMRGRQGPAVAHQGLASPRAVAPADASREREETGLWLRNGTPGVRGIVASEWQHWQGGAWPQGPAKNAVGPGSAVRRAVEQPDGADGASRRPPGWTGGDRAAAACSPFGEHRRRSSSGCSTDVDWLGRSWLT
jgi:hypothetical protein